MKKLFNKFNFAIICLVLALCFGGTALFASKQVDAAQYVAQIETIKYTTLQDAVDAVTANNPTKITLLADANIDQPIEIGGTKNITLDLNNFNVTNENGTVFKVRGILTLTGEGGSVFGAMTQSAEETLAQVCVIFVDAGATFEQTGGTISTVGEKIVSGIKNYGTFVMRGGEISNNGKGIYNEGTIQIYDGLITSNRYSGGGAGGGIENKNGTVTMFGGQISNNGSQVGGGIYNNGGKVDIRGGIISGNQSKQGGGIYNNSHASSRVAIEAMVSAKISNNKAEMGAGIYNEGELEVNNAEITDNETIQGRDFSCGGGVYNCATAVLTSCTITGNKANEGSGIYNKEGSSISITNCEITNNGDDASQNVCNYGVVNAQEIKVDGIFVNGSATNTTAQFDVTGNTNEIKHLQNYATVSISNCTISGEFVNNSGTADFDTCSFTQTTNSTLTIKDDWVIVENSTVSGRIDVDKAANLELRKTNFDLLNNLGTVNIRMGSNGTTVVNHARFTLSSGEIKTLMIASSSATTILADYAEVIFFAQIATVDMKSRALGVPFTVITGYGLPLKDKQLFANYRGVMQPFYHGNINDYQLHTEFFLQLDGQDNVFSRLIDASAISVQQNPTVTQYKYGQQLDKTGLVVLASYTNGTTDYIDAGDVQVVYQNGNFFKAGDTQVTLRYVNKQGQNIDCVLDDLVVTKSVVTKPATDKQTVTYNGQKQVAEVSAPDNVTVTNDGGTDAGSYTVTIALNDKNNYQWSDGTSDDLSFEFEIAKGQIEIGDVTFEGTDLDENKKFKPVAQVSFGQPVFSYATTKDGEYSAETPTKAGKYFVKVTVAGTDNYVGAEKIIEFELVDSGLSAWAIAGIATGSVALSGGVGVGIWFLIKKRKRI